MKQHAEHSTAKLAEVEQQVKEAEKRADKERQEYLTALQHMRYEEGARAQN